MVRWLRLRLPPALAGGAGSIPGRGAKIPHASRLKNQNRKLKQYCSKFNKDFKNGPHQKKKKSLEKKKAYEEERQITKYVYIYPII